MSESAPTQNPDANKKHPGDFYFRYCHLDGIAIKYLLDLELNDCCRDFDYKKISLADYHANHNLKLS